MEATESGSMLLRAAHVAILSTILMGLILYVVIRAFRFGPSSLIRCLLGSLVCSAVVLGCFALSAVLTFACGPTAAVFLVVSLLVGVILALPIQLLILGLSLGRGVVVWIVYMVFTPVVVLWMMVLLAAIF